MVQPSEYEIQRELEALKDLRRRSTTSGALLDPDLPNGPAPSDEAASAPPNNPADDPLHLFWVPASLHPEIAPAEFRAFLKEHARSPADAPADPSSSAPPPALALAASISRKKSMLSRQYRPAENDGVEHESVVPLKRNRSLLYPATQPALTISDLRLLEELVEEAAESADPAALRSVLRRSLSLSIAPPAAEIADEPADEADAPIIVPPPGQILRRAARTKIRKPGLQGDGGGHRFPASRRGTAKHAQPDTRTSSDVSSSDHGDDAPSRRHTRSDEGAPRPESYSEEAAIYDAYVRDDDDEPPFVLDVPPAVQEAPPPTPPLLLVDPPVLHQPQPQHLMPPHQEQAPPSRTPSPIEPVPVPIARPQSAPIPHPPPPPPAPSAPGRKDKDKASKSLFKWGSDKGAKKGAKDKEREAREQKEKEKESGFFGSLFGGGRKKQDAEYSAAPVAGGAAGREAAAALLGASKSSKAYQPPPSPGLAPGIGGNPYARYPIHVERAIYRLSHIKLANPRRPLYEQVLISNLMFWYLGVINKAQAPPAGAEQAGEGEAEREERERAAAAVAREREAREKEEREKAEAEAREKEARERELLDAKRREGGRRGSLTKTLPAGSAPGARRAEMPIKGPQYEMQHRVMEQEYGAYSANGAPPPPQTPNGHAPPPLRAPQPVPYLGPPPVQLVAPPVPRTAGAAPEPYYYQPPPSDGAPRSPGLPPGAMQPAEWGPPQQQQQQQRAGSPPAAARRHSPGPGPRRSQSPPPPPRLHHANTSQERLGGGGRAPGRSLSATVYSAAGGPAGNGAPLRKGHSANAAVAHERVGGGGGAGRRPRTAERASEEEDVPLAVYQQRRK
ncbi:hypothetical protein HYPSUDRAFT_579945 [Hypholoma sublateritium FD-334 SS-4]|uniref:Protein Zds1 C-terminal domain-containing protein n=1 Tax=Hypholoma sublateritium (strain FD-334 SS-4) TaxID=945553 RepID=A0A0D2P488_HYPSF|nr:hypothetical protein HYPSUDRAFT_579945 [Hypholoma sublateritium FD-334 SS-4]